ncbi:MAG: alpha/beta hydrolase [Solirubrobacterales bacterium]
MSSNPSGLWTARLDPSGAARDQTLLLVHGAHCASWVWQNLMPDLVAAGWPCLTFDWRGHGESPAMPDADLVEYGLLDVVADIDSIAAEVEGEFVVLAHSIGGLAALKHAECGARQPAGLALLAPAPPAHVGGYDFPAVDPAVPTPAPDLSQARELFFHDLGEADLASLTDAMEPESPRVLNDSGRLEIEVNPALVSGPICVVSGELDTIQGGAAAGLDRATASSFGAEYFLRRGQGHMLPVEDGWKATALLLRRWLARQFP